MSSYNESEHFASIDEAGNTLESLVHSAWQRGIHPEHAVHSARAQGVTVSATYVLAMYELYDAEYQDHRDLVPSLTIVERKAQ